MIMYGYKSMRILLISVYTDDAQNNNEYQCKLQTQHGNNKITPLDDQMSINVKIFNTTNYL